MRLRIAHTTRYQFSGPVFLEQHVIRLEPRSDPMQRIVNWNIQVRPEPMARSHALDAQGNSALHVWFSGLTDSLEVRAAGEVETLRANPYDFLFATPEAERVPAVDADDQEATALAPFRARQTEGEAVAAWTDAALAASGGRVSDFLNTLNQRMYAEIRGVVREDGDPYPPQQTLTAGEASCRDVSVAFVACCRRVGLAARFVSGYQVGDPDTEHRHLHAWAEVYLPGGGWRGYDPTHGMAVADGHVALAAAAEAAGAAPVSGTFRGAGMTARMSAELFIDIV